MRAPHRRGDKQGAGFRFVGFLPTRNRERAQALQAVAAASDTTVVFEAPHRIQALLQDLATAAPTRRVTVCRELTKQFETVTTLPAETLPAWLAADANRSRGEFVLVLHASAQAPTSAGEDQHDRVLVPLLRELPLKQAVALAMQITAAPRNTLYERALALRDDAQ